jgi:hypothetical protein
VFARAACRRGHNEVHCRHRETKQGRKINAVHSPFAMLPSCKCFRLTRVNNLVISALRKGACEKHTSCYCPGPLRENLERGRRLVCGPIVCGCKVKCEKEEKNRRSNNENNHMVMTERKGMNERLRPGATRGTPPSSSLFGRQRTEGNRPSYD